MSACNRNDKAFVMKMDAITTDGMLYIQQDERTVRLPLKDGAIIAIENRADDHMQASKFGGKDHFGWYYMMNGRVQQEYAINVPYDKVPGVVRCLTIPGADDGMESITSADCSVTNFP